MLRLSLLFGAAPLFLAPVAAAENQIWTNIDLKTKPSKESRYEYGLTTEMRFDPTGNVGTLVLRPGVGYKVNDKLKVSGGYRFASSRRSGPDQIEHRLWQQAAYDLFEAGKFEFGGRTRLEQRWRDGNGETGWRIRQQLSVEHPLDGTPLTLGLSDEGIFGLNDTGWGNFEGLQENRAKAVVKWKAAGAGWELGYMNQYKNGINGRDDETNHHVVIGLSKSF